MTEISKIMEVKIIFLVVNSAHLDCDQKTNRDYIIQVPEMMTTTTVHNSSTREGQIKVRNNSGEFAVGTNMEFATGISGEFVVCMYLSWFYSYLEKMKHKCACVGCVD